MRLSIIYSLLIFLNISSSFCKSDLTILGNILKEDGWGQIPANLINMLGNDLSINIFPGNVLNEWNKPTQLQNFINYDKNNFSDVLIYTSLLCLKNPLSINIPRQKLNIAYSMVEFSKIPNSLANLLNANFDAVVIPNKNLLNTYKNSKINIPIYVLPLPLELDKYLNVPINRVKNDTFVFGSSAAFIDRKNNIKTVKAFIRAFKNNPKVKLIIHGRYSDLSIIKKIKKIISKKQVKNIQIIEGVLNEEQYFNFMKSIDCYVLLSKGEGFSISPYQALALGIPCILSNNTAHGTICEKEFVYGVQCNIQEKINNNNIFGEDIGHYLNCSTKDAAKALKHVYNNYDKYISMSQRARAYSAQYSGDKLREFYKMLIRPKNIYFGSVNDITQNSITTNSMHLYNIYKQLMLSN